MDVGNEDLARVSEDGSSLAASLEMLGASSGGRDGSVSGWKTRVRFRAAFRPGLRPKGKSRTQKMRIWGGWEAEQGSGAIPGASHPLISLLEIGSCSGDAGAGISVEGTIFGEQSLSSEHWQASVG